MSLTEFDFSICTAAAATTTIWHNAEQFSGCIFVPMWSRHQVASSLGGFNVRAVIMIQSFLTKHVH